MLYDTVDEYNTQITAIQATITRILTTGQSSGSSIAGNSRNYTDVDLTKLNEYLVLLKRERDSLKGKIMYPQAGW